MYRTLFTSNGTTISARKLAEALLEHPDLEVFIDGLGCETRICEIGKSDDRFIIEVSEAAAVPTEWKHSPPISLRDPEMSEEEVASFWNPQLSSATS